MFVVCARDACVCGVWPSKVAPTPFLKMLRIFLKNLLGICVAQADIPTVPPPRATLSGPAPVKCLCVCVCGGGV